MPAALNALACERIGVLWPLSANSEIFANRSVFINTKKTVRRKPYGFRNIEK